MHEFSFSLPQLILFYIIEKTVRLKSVSKDEVLGIQEEDKAVVFQKFDQNDKKQIWIRREEKSKGYFTLKNVSYDMILTATSGYGLKIDVDGMYVK